MTLSRDVIIIGAGMAGLTAAHQLQYAGLGVTLLDKGRGVGGRMATRRIDQARVDHGAQFFTVRDPAFADAVKTWHAGLAAQLWCRGFNEDDGHPRYRGTRGMSDIPKYLAQDLDVRPSTRVVQIEHDAGQWRLQDQDQNRYAARALLITAPAPQAVELLAQSRIQLPTAVDAELKHIRYNPCLALLLTLQGPSGMQTPGGMQINGEPIHWISDAKVKGISPDQHALTIHAGADFSKDYWDASDADIQARLLGALPFEIASEVQSRQVMRWRYSQPWRLCSEPCLIAETPGVIAFAGDAYVHARVEGAYLSGRAAGQRLAAML